MKVFNQIEKWHQQGEKVLALLIDPDKCQGEGLVRQARLIEAHRPHMVMVGGSHVSHPVEEIVDFLKNNTSRPIVLYPGNPVQVSFNADALLFLSMISGRNPELLIGAHVTVAHAIKQHHLETIPTGYMLIDGGTRTSVEYISQTQPIPADKTDIAVATALAGQLLGLKMIYMDAGSGAKHAISREMIAGVHENTDLPLMIGGGINSADRLKAAYEAGADIVVVGTALEKEPELLQKYMHIAQNASRQPVKDKFLL